MSDTFKIGDVVELMSGGPHMTVIEVDESFVSTTWFFKNKLESGRFPIGAVRAPEEDEGMHIISF